MAGVTGAGFLIALNIVFAALNFEVTVHGGEFWWGLPHFVVGTFNAGVASFAFVQVREVFL